MGFFALRKGVVSPFEEIVLISIREIGHGATFMQIFDRLVFMDTDGQFYPWLADSWEQSKDGKSITFRYRFYFHEGDQKQGQVAEKYSEYIRSNP